MKLLCNRPRSIYQYFNKAPRLSGQTSIFGVVSFVSKSLLGIEGQRKLEKIAILPRKPRSHARILIYRTCPIDHLTAQIWWKSNVTPIFCHAFKLSLTVFVVLIFLRHVSFFHDPTRLESAERSIFPPNANCNDSTSHEDDVLLNNSSSEDFCTE